MLISFNFDNRAVPADYFVLGVSFGFPIQIVSWSNPTK